MADDPIDLALEKTKRAKSKTKPNPSANTNGAAAPDNAGLHYKANGKLETSVHNAIVMLEEKHLSKFQFNELERTIEMQDSDPPGAQMTDRDVIGIQDILQMEGMRTVGRECVHDAIVRVAMEIGYHPITDWLDFLVWDGTPRIDMLFPKYFGSNPFLPTDYEMAVSRYFMLGLVARVQRPGCKCDYMPVIEGPQGVKKSTACRRLVGDEFFGDNLPDPGSKDASQYLRGLWLVEVAELTAFKGARATTIKAFLTRQEERYRPPYARSEVLEKRQCCFIGTTNQETYLEDVSGGRRFWPIKAGVIDIDGIVHDRDQLFAEAMHRFRDGERWWPTSEEESEWFKPEQEARFMEDSLEGPIEEVILSRTEFSLSEVMRALGYDTTKQQTSAQRQFLKAITRIVERSNGIWCKAPRSMSERSRWVRKSSASWKW